MNDYRLAQKKLMSKRAEIILQLQQLDLQLHQPERPNQQTQDESTRISDDNELNQTLKNNWNYELQNIENALHKIAEGSYGMCTSCGESIKRSRLMALPYVRECFQCASAHEENISSNHQQVS